MADNGLSKIVAGLRRVVLLHDGTAQTDAKLLGSYVERRDETAFEALLLRHGPMVMGVCRRILRNADDVDDAFQATFLVLVRKADSVKPREQIGNWLYGVAHHTAIRTRALSAKRGAREKQVLVMPDSATHASQPSMAPEKEAWQQALDQELSHLPGKYRAAIVLCDLEGRTQKEAARQLSWPEGSVASRLSRGRALLVKRLAKYGAALSGEALAVTLSTKTASAHVPAALASVTLKAAISMAAGQTAPGGAISAPVILITKGVLTSMFLTKLKTVAVTGIVLCVLGIGVGASFLAGQTPGEGAQPPLVRQGGQVASQPGAAAQKPSDDTAKKPGDADSSNGKSSAPGKQLDGNPATKSDQKDWKSVEGRLKALDESIAILVEQVRSLETQFKGQKKQSKAPPAPTNSPTEKKEMIVLTLRHLEAAEVANTLNELFNPRDPPNFGGGGFARMAGGFRDDRVRIALSASTNTIILQGTREDMDMAEAIVLKLETTGPRNRPTETKTETKRDDSSPGKILKK